MKQSPQLEPLFGSCASLQIPISAPSRASAGGYPTRFQMTAASSAMLVRGEDANGGSSTTSETLLPGRFCRDQAQCTAPQEVCGVRGQAESAQGPLRLRSCFAAPLRPLEKCFARETAAVEKAKAGKVNPYLLPNGLARDLQIQLPHL